MCRKDNQAKAEPASYSLSGLTPKAPLGKIGEGAAFSVQWGDNTGLNRKALFSVYFHGFSGYHTIRIKFLPNGETVMYEGERLHKPTSEDTAPRKE